MNVGPVLRTAYRLPFGIYVNNHLGRHDQRLRGSCPALDTASECAVFANDPL